MNATANTIFRNDTTRIDYNPDECWLTVHQEGSDEVPILIGADGLIKAGLQLIKFTRAGLDFQTEVYEHIDGVFAITFHEDSADLIFSSGNRYALMEPIAEDLIDLGWALIDRGHDLNLDNDKRRYGSRVVFTEVNPEIFPGLKLATPPAPRLNAGWIGFNVAGSNPKTSTRAIRRDVAKLARRAVKKAGAK